MECVIFDLDGTLLDSKKTILRCLNAALREFGYETFGDDDLYSLIGMDLGQILELKGGNRPDLRERYTSIQLSTFKEDMFKYPGVDKLLSSVRDSGYKMGVATMRRTRISNEVMAGFDILKYFDLVLGADSVSEAKPSAVHSLAACERLGCEPSASILVGDSKFDMLSGKSAGCFTIGVTWGMGTVEDLKKHGADDIVDSVEELKALLLEKRES